MSQLLLHNLSGLILPPVFDKMAALQKAYKKSCVCDAGSIFIWKLVFSQGSVGILVSFNLRYLFLSLA